MKLSARIMVDMIVKRFGNLVMRYMRDMSSFSSIKGSSELSAGCMKLSFSCQSSF